MIATLIVVVYALGWFVTWVGAAQHWYSRFHSSTESDYIEGAVWGMLVAIFWPIFVPAWAMGKVLR